MVKPGRRQLLLLARWQAGIAGTRNRVPAVRSGVWESAYALAVFGVVPIENSTEGTVNYTLDRFLTSPLHICGEVELRIHQHLMGRMDSLEHIERVCSHQQSLAQCRGWLDEHLPEAERLQAGSNAEAARRARDEKGTAAIAGEAAAEVYGLNLIAAEIEDHPAQAARAREKIRDQRVIRVEETPPVRSILGARVVE